MDELSINFFSLLGASKIPATGPGITVTLEDSKKDMTNGDHFTVEEMRLTEKSEGEQQLKPNNSNAPNEDQEEEIQQSEQHTPARQRTQRADTQPSRCRLPSRRTPTTSSDRTINLLRVFPWPTEWIFNPYRLPALFELYPEFLLVFKEAFHDISHCLKAQMEKIGLPIILHLFALSTLYFYKFFLPTILSLSFFILLVLLLLLFIIVFILIFF
ncbi:transmembrane protein 31 isoform X5 [Pongo abelii]|nr:transmembrane protein 31 isoform X5 [Pongo abelii]